MPSDTCCPEMARGFGTADFIPTASPQPFFPQTGISCSQLLSHAAACVPWGAAMQDKKDEGSDKGLVALRG